MLDFDWFGAIIATLPPFMFLFAFMALLFSVLPIKGGPNIPHSPTPDFKVVSSWGVNKIPTPVEIANSDNQKDDGNKPANPPGQTISPIARTDHPGGISDDVHEVIPSNKVFPTPIISPVPVTTDTPTPTPGEIEPSIIPMPTGPGGCPPCYGGGGKVECPEVVCPF